MFLIAGVSPLPGAVLVLHSLPLEFPLAIAFAEQLLTWKLEESSERSEDELDTVPPSVLLLLVELLGGFTDIINTSICLMHALFLKDDLLVITEEETFVKVYRIYRTVRHTGL